MKNGAGNSGRWLDVSPDRFPGWIASFAVRHAAGAVDAPADPDGLLTVALTADHVTFTAQDGATADCYPPFPPSAGLWTLPALAAGAVMVTPDPAGEGTAGAGPDGGGAAAAAAAIAAHARRPRAVGVLLARLGGYAAGVFTGYPPELADAKVGSRLVHGRSAAGGWSQHRFARRREKQASEALRAAADAAVLVFGRWPPTQITARSARAGRPAGRAGGQGERRDRSGAEIMTRGGAAASSARGPALDAVVLGGDRRAVAELRADPRLAPYLALAAERFLTVGDPKRAVLAAAPKLFLAVRIRLTEPSGAEKTVPGPAG